MRVLRWDEIEVRCEVKEPKNQSKQPRNVAHCLAHGVRNRCHACQIAHPPPPKNFLAHYENLIIVRLFSHRHPASHAASIMSAYEQLFEARFHPHTFLCVFGREMSPDFQGAADLQEMEL